MVSFELLFHPPKRALEVSTLMRYGRYTLLTTRIHIESLGLVQYPLQLVLDFNLIPLAVPEILQVCLFGNPFERRVL